MNVIGFVNTPSWNDMDACCYYRVFLPLRDTNQSEFVTARVVNNDEVKGRTDDELGQNDVFFLSRAFDGSQSDLFIESVHFHGGVVVLDFDDDLTEDYKVVSGRGEDTKLAISKVDYVTVSRPELAEHLSQWSKRPPVVLKNCVDTEFMRRRAESARRLFPERTIGYSGSPTHWGDWYLSHSQFARVCREHPSIQPILHGEVPRYMNYIEGASQLAGVPFSMYPVLLSQFDFVICAVDVDDPFNSGKSAVKALECMALGVVPICSRFPPYLELKSQNAPIIVVEEETRDGWYDAFTLAATMTDSDLDALASLGPDWVRTHRDMTNTGWKQWETFFLSLREDSS